MRSRGCSGKPEKNLQGALLHHLSDWHQPIPLNRLEDERAARLAEVAAVEADLKLLGVVVGQGEAALQATEHRAVTRYPLWIAVVNHDLIQVFSFCNSGTWFSAEKRSGWKACVEHWGWKVSSHLVKERKPCKTSPAVLE